MTRYVVRFVRRDGTQSLRFPDALDAEDAVEQVFLAELDDIDVRSVEPLADE